jgi:hypothetical protein
VDLVRGGGRDAMKGTLVTVVGVVGTAALLLAAIFLLGRPSHGPSQDAVPAEESGKTQRGEPGEASASGGPRILSGEEARRQHARWYARDYGVSLDEAIRRLEMQDDRLPADLERELKKSEGEAYAGLWLRHPDYGLTVATAGDPEAMKQKIEPFVAGTKWEGTVNVKRVEASMKELNAARAETQNIVDRLGISRVSSDLNVFKNRAEFYVPDRAKFERRLAASGLKLPEHVAII